MDLPGFRGAWQVWRMYAEAEKLVKRNREHRAALRTRERSHCRAQIEAALRHAVPVVDSRPGNHGRVAAPQHPACNAGCGLGHHQQRIYSRVRGIGRCAAVAHREIRPGSRSRSFSSRAGFERTGEASGSYRRPTLLTVSRIVKANRYKGHDVVLRALPEVVRAVPGVAYVIVGEGDDLGYLSRLAASMACRRTSSLPGACQTPNFLCSTTPAMPSSCAAAKSAARRGILAEGFGIALVEASACGKPVIAGRSGGIADAVQDGVTGLLVNPVDTEEVASAIVRLLREPDLAKRLGENGGCGSRAK